MAKIEFDDARWPFVRVTFPESFTDDEWNAHIERATAILARGATGFLMDIRSSAAPNAAQRRRVWVALTDGAIPGGTRFAYLVGNSMARGALTAILWLGKPPAPFKVFTSESDATSWAMKAL